MRRYEPDMRLREVGQIACRLASYKRREAQAIEYARRAFGLCERPYLAISGGKDSVAMAGIVDRAARELGRDFVLWAHVSDASFPGTEETIRATGERLGRPVVLDRSPVSAFDVVGLQSRARFGKTGYFFEAIERFLVSGRYDLAFVGVRAAESARRKKACIAQGPIFRTTVPAPHWKCHPLAWFAVEDVAATLVSYDLPIHPIYEKVAVDARTIRLGYVTALDLLGEGTAIFLRLNYPDLYQRLVAAYPEIARWT